MRAQVHDSMGAARAVALFFLFDSRPNAAPPSGPPRANVTFSPLRVRHLTSKTNAPLSLTCHGRRALTVAALSPSGLLIVILAQQPHYAHGARSTSRAPSPCRDAAFRVGARYPNRGACSCPGLTITWQFNVTSGPATEWPLLIRGKQARALTRPLRLPRSF
jgi:hypothetical protein